MLVRRGAASRGRLCPRGCLRDQGSFQKDGNYTCPYFDVEYIWAPVGAIGNRRQSVCLPRSGTALLLVGCGRKKRARCSDAGEGLERPRGREEEKKKQKESLGRPADINITAVDVDDVARGVLGLPRCGSGSACWYSRFPRQ